MIGNNKKGNVTGDTVDLLFIAIVGFFAILFIISTFNWGIQEAEKVSQSKISEFKRADSAINNLRVQSQEDIFIDSNNINERIKRSRILGGKTITDCHDYITITDCNADTVGIWEPNSGIYCEWNKEKNECWKWMKFV